MSVKARVLVAATIAGLSLWQTALAEKVRLRPAEAGDAVVAKASAEVDQGSQVVLLEEAKQMREQGYSDKAKIQDLQDKLREAYTALERESTKAAYRGDGSVGEFAIAEWKINPVFSLKENMMKWRKQAEDNTRQEIHFVWELPGPVELNVPAIFYGNWRDALWQLSLAFEENGWDIQIDVAKANNVVIFKPYNK